MRPRITMPFNIKNPTVQHASRAYIQVLGKRMYLKPSEVDRAIHAGYAIHFE